MSDVKCPKCKSTHITANKKGFSGKKALVGGIITGPIGLLAGTIGSNKVLITCLECGHRFLPGQGAKKPVRKKQNDASQGLTAILLVIIVIVVMIFYQWTCN